MMEQLKNVCVLYENYFIKDKRYFIYLVGVFGAYVGYHTVNYLLYVNKLKQLRKKRKRTREKHLIQIEESLAQVEHSLVTEISLLSTRELLAAIKEGKYTPTEVLNSYQAKALEAHKKTNCVIEFITEAETWAMELERKPSSSYPLYGLPVSLKDNYPVQGYDSTEGKSSLIGEKYPHDCTMVKVLKRLGAVPFVRTNMPQLGSSHESSNPIFGTTLNPLDLARGPGGSSSGEGALLALQGSPLGFGSDTGGSIRCPAAFCGITSIKPTFNRLSLKGRPDFNGQTMSMSCSSPIARDVDTLVLAMESLTNSGMNEEDSYLPPLTFNTDEFTSKRPLRIGYYFGGGICEPWPVYIKAVNIAVDILKEKGHTMVEWVPPNGDQGLLYNVACLCADGGQGMAEALHGDSIDKSLTNSYFMYYLPASMKRFFFKFYGQFVPFVQQIGPSTLGCKNVYEWWNLKKEIGDFRETFAQSWQEAGLDAVISPGFGCLPVPLNNSMYLLEHSGNSMLYNILDYPAGVLPVTTVSLSDADNMKEFADRQGSISEAVLTSVGLPVAVQCSTQSWREELCLRVMKEIEDGL